MTLAGYSTEPLAARHADAMARFLEAHSAGCFCRYWHFPGDKNAWLAELGSGGSRSRTAFLDGLHAGSDESTGVVALRGEELVGWLKLAPRSALAKLYRQRPYGALPALQEGSGGWAVGCLLVAPEHRRRGLATALLERALALGTERDWPWIDAFPRGGSHEPDALVWTGPRGLFEAAGFVPIAGEPPYPVLRRWLRPSPSP